MKSAAFIVALLTAASLASADVVHTNPNPDVRFPGDPEYLGVDLNGDGIDEFALNYKLLPPNCPIPEGCPQWGEARVQPLNSSGGAWMTTNRLADRAIVGPGRDDYTTEAVVLLRYRDYVTTGPWVGSGPNRTTGAIGVRFLDASGAPHFGWIRVINAGGAFDTMYLMDFAFQTTPNSPITVGAACDADVNASGAVDSQDFFDFAAGFFAADPSADFNGSGTVTSQDFFDFIAAFFAGC